MSGDLEEFLRRAAQRRQAKVAAEREQAAAEGPLRQSKPQYSDARTERTVRTPIESDTIDAEVAGGRDGSTGDSMVARQRERIAAAQRQAAEVRKQAAESAKKIRSRATASKTAAAAPAGLDGSLTGNPAEDLIVALQNPNGLLQAMLLREVLDRPEQRW